MPITCELTESKVSQYLNTTDFVYAYPDPNLRTPLGLDYKFERCLLPAKYQLYKDEIENFEVFPDDVYLTALMKTGSNWCQEMIWLLDNKLNYEEAAKSKLVDRFPLLEFDILYEGVEKNQLEYAEKLPPTRHLKLHLPAGLLPKKLWTVKPKIVYISRGVKDMAVSLYHHALNFADYKCSISDFFEAFLSNKTFLAPYLDHIKYFWLMRHEENILFLRYEDLKTDLLQEIKKVSSFLGKSYSDHDLFKLKEHLSIDALRKNPSFNFSRHFKEVISGNVSDVSTDGFIRKGIVGSYKEEMSMEMIEKFDKWTMEYNSRNGTCIDL